MIIAAGIELPEAQIADICRRHQVRELSLLGRRVDLAVMPALKPLIRPGVLAEARLIYAA